MASRLHSINTDIFRQRFGQLPTLTIQTPGRINLIGEHTDYNGGFVLPAAIDKYAMCSLRTNEVGSHRIHAIDLDDYIEIPLGQFHRSEKSWVNYFIGILAELDKIASIGAIDCVFNSEIPIGAGMSSSSALECGFIKGLNELFSLQLSNWDIINISQQSNYNFLGVKGGIMDQFICLHGKKDHATLLDCASQTHRYVEVDLPDHSFVLVNSMVAHDHTTSAYNVRVAEMKELLAAIKTQNKYVKAWRDIDLEMIQNLHTELDQKIINRGIFYIEENMRVIQFEEYLASGQIERLGKLLSDSHQGLRDQYQVSCEELDFLVNRAMESDDVLGARMMGGGFGGCTLNLISNNAVQQFCEDIQQAYQAQFHKTTEIYRVNLADGSIVV